jgi:Tfp pilus assembly protein PilN
MLWLTSMIQDGPSVTIEGRSTTQVALADFVGNLGSNALLQKPIEIMNSQVETGGAGPAGQSAAETIKFTVKAQLAGMARAGGPGGRGGAAGK